MKRTMSRIAIACIALLNAAVSHATSTDPFDFDYEISGGIVERPALIFNDGSKTYIQPRAGQVITALGGHSEGPYVVVDGTPETLTYTVAGHTATARWTKANTFIGGAARGALGALHDDEPPAFDGFTNRLVLIGSHSSLEPVRSMKVTTSIGSIVKALAPQGWTGSAQKDVDLTDSIAFATTNGENWMQALDRLMTRCSLYADVDFMSRHIRLHRDAPKSGALDYAAGANSQRGVGAHANTEKTAAINGGSSQSQPSLLAEYFGAQAIRDGDDTHTQIRFIRKPAGDMTFKTLEGRSLHPRWNQDTNVMTVERAEHMLVSDGARTVEVTRLAGTVFDFDVENRAHLLAVFENEGQTYFKFDDAVVVVHVSDVNHLGSGEQKGHFYKFNGTAERFIVTADGNAVNVTRRHNVKYSEGPAPASPVAPTVPATAGVKS